MLGARRHTVPRAPKCRDISRPRFTAPKWAGELTKMDINCHGDSNVASAKKVAKMEEMES